MSSNDVGVTGGDDSISVRELARRCGDIHGKVMKMASELSKLSADELIERSTDGLHKLHERKLVTDTELDHLLGVVSTISGDGSPRERFDRVEGIRQQVETSSGSPYAIVIAGIAADSSRTEAERIERADLHADSAAGTAITVAADVAGGIGGVFIGDELCGVPCGVLAGASGALGGSLLAQELLQ
ncbi:MAG: hypothetical protein QOG20_2325 [Pseudonocardiales bacterium]|jgi:hypothetical protein|nr:hypothetical protein [Pseudonocardiales bacterium]